MSTKKAYEEDNFMVVKVNAFTANGHHDFIMPSNIYARLGIYITKFRNAVNGVKMSGDDHVFLSWNCRPLTSSASTKQVNSFWKKAFKASGSVGEAGRLSKGSCI